MTNKDKIEVKGFISHQNYNVKVIAIDKHIKTRISTEVTQKTLNEKYILKDGEIDEKYQFTSFVKYSDGGNSVSFNNGRYQLTTNYGGSFAGIYTTEQIDFTAVKKVKIKFAFKTNTTDMSDRFSFGLQSEITKDLVYDANLSSVKTTNISTETKDEIIIDTTSVVGSKFLKCASNHTSYNGWTANVYIDSISLIYE